MIGRSMSLLDQGFAIIENCCSRPKCVDLAIRLEAFESGGSRCLLDHDWCQAFAEQLKRRMEDRVPELSSLAAVQCTYFHKSPSRNWFVAWHQDRSLPVAAEVRAAEWSGWSQKEGMTFIHSPDDVLDRMIAVRLHIDDSTYNNGPLRVLPGSHRYRTLNRERIEELRRSSRAQPLVVNKGGVVIMRPLLLHASSTNERTDLKPEN